MQAFRKFLENLMKTKTDEKGQTVIEYILVIVLVSLVLIAVFTGTGVRTGVETAGANIETELSKLPSTTPPAP